MQSVNMKTEQCIKFLNFIFGDDLDFYEEFAIHLSDEEQEKFFDDNPDFMCDFPPNLPKLLYIGFKLIPQIPYKIGV